MAGNIATLHLFANDVGPEALSLLDNNFTPLLQGLNSPANFGNYYVDSGAVNALAISLASNQTLAALTDGLLFQIKVGNTTTTTTPTLNVAGLGARTIVSPANTALAVGQLVAGQFVEMIYDFTNNVFRVFNQASGGVGLFASGSAANPGVSFLADATTGMYLSAAGVLGFATAGVSRLLIDAHGQASFTSDNAGVSAALTVSSGTSNSWIAEFIPNSGLNGAQGVALSGALSGSLGSIYYELSNTPGGNAFFQLWNTNFVGAPLGGIAAAPAAALFTGGAQPLYLGVNNAAYFRVAATGLLAGYGPTAGAFVDMTPDSGTFTATFTGFTAAQTGTATWRRVGNLVTISLPTIAATSNTTAMSITGIPSAIQPPTLAQNSVLMGGQDNTVMCLAAVGVNAASGTWTVYKVTVGGAGNGFNSSGWTAAGTKGLAAPSFSYLLV